MEHASPLETRRRALRAKICTSCFKRPEGCDAWSADQGRDCEPQCPIFINLPRLLQIVHRYHTDSIEPYDHAIAEEICGRCEVSPSPGDYCPDRKQAFCPLARYE